MLTMNVVGKPYEGELHVRFDVAGDGSQCMIMLFRHSNGKLRETVMHGL